MKTYIIEHVHEPQRYWNRELQDWRRDRQEATVYTESEREKSLQLEVRGKLGFLPASGCWILVSEPNEAELQIAMAATSYLDDPRKQMAHLCKNTVEAFWFGDIPKGYWFENSDL